MPQPALFDETIFQAGFGAGGGSEPQMAAQEGEKRALVRILVQPGMFRDERHVQRTLGLAQRAVALDPKVGTHFLGNVEELWETEDSEAVEWEEFLSKWYEHFHDKPVTRRSFISRCVSPSAWGFSNSASMMHSTKRYQRTLLKR